MLAAETDNEGAGGRLVLAHGFTQTARCWSDFATELASDREVVRVDMPGTLAAGGCDLCDVTL